MRAATSLVLVFLLSFHACAPPDAPVPPVRVAVAASFSGVHEALARRFTEGTGIPVRSSVGSTGQLYAQIRNGAPFDLFLAADAERPRLLEEEGLVRPRSYTYARGRLALVAGPPGGAAPGSSREGAGPPGPGPSALLAPGVRRVALANPRTAPYGAAAVETLEALGLTQRMGERLVPVENVSQAWQLVASGAAELGFVALAQVRDVPPERVWVVPDSLHTPLLHDAVLLDGAGVNGTTYLDFLRGPEAKRIIEAAGYEAAGGIEPGAGTGVAGTGVDAGGTEP